MEEPTIQDTALTVHSIEHARVIEHLKNLLDILPKATVSLWTTNLDQTIIQHFLNGPGRKSLFFYLENNVLCCMHKPPHITPKEMLYFIADLNTDEQITVETFNLKVLYGLVSGNVLKNLLTHLEQVFFPSLLAYQGWHKSIRTDFLNQFQRFMASVTDSVYHQEGRTMLYVPKETDELIVEVVDKELVVRLEMLVVQWTRQIKDVLNSSQNAIDNGDRSSPMDEIRYWKNRCEDLSGIYQQLHDPNLKLISTVLETAKSPYLDQFKRSADLINQGTLEAQDNLKFLNILVDPCQTLSELDTKDMGPCLVILGHYVRFIYNHSKYYCTPDKIMGLLQKINNQIIKQCTQKISLEDIFQKDVLASILVLEECSNACENWKVLYKDVTKNAWKFDENSIFAQLDAFIQRCRDLLEICEAQIQFARKTTDGNKLPMPAFGNTLKVDSAKSLIDIENTFQKHLAKLWLLKDIILDVKASKWYDEYSSFKQGIKELEVMMQNLINAAFEGNHPIARNLENLEIFYQLAKREAIRRTFEKKAADMWVQLINEINLVKDHFEANRKAPMILRTQPNFAGSVYWARSLVKKMKYTMNLYKDAYFLPVNASSVEATTIYEALIETIEDYSFKLHRDWTEETDKNMAKGLDKAVIVIENKIQYNVNFDKDILKMFLEIFYFQKLKCDIPFQFMEIYRKKDDLRLIRESTIQICRDYNEILLMLNDSEQDLFRERLHFIERKLKPGLSKITWDCKSSLDVFLKESKKAMIDLQSIVSAFLRAQKEIQTECQKISNTANWSIEPQKIYTVDELLRSQRLCGTNISKNIRQNLACIDKNIKSIFEVIRHDGIEISAVWFQFVKNIDKLVVTSFKECIKASLLLASRAIIGEGKGKESLLDAQPLVGIDVVLENLKLEFSPSLKRLQESVVIISQEIISIIDEFEPFQLDYSLNESDIETNIHKSIHDEEEFKKIIASIQSGMGSTELKISKYVHTWDAYKEIWEVNKDAFIRRYAKLKPALSTFDADINRYNEVANNIQKEETLIPIDFIRLDCSPLKHALVGHCNVWQNKLTGVLNNTASTQLQELHNMISENTSKLLREPVNLEELEMLMFLHSQLADEIIATQEQFQPVQEKYAILEKYEVPISEKEVVDMASLVGCWTAFTLLFEESGRKLKDHKARFKANLGINFEELQKNYTQMRDDLLTSGPYKYDMKFEIALPILSGFKTLLLDYDVKEKTIRKGMALFQIEEKGLKDRDFLNSEVDNLNGLWSIIQDWQSFWTKVSTPHIKLVDFKQLDDESHQFVKRLGKFNKDCKEWDIYIRQKDKATQLRKIVPLLQELQTPAIRDRHWKTLMTGMNVNFNPHSPEFNLNFIISLEIENHSDIIVENCASAVKELSFEQELSRIDDMWKTIKLDIVNYKDEKGYMKIKSIEVISEVLEENQVSLSSMKASKFSKAFEHQISDWEKKVSLISELVDVLMQVQKQWMYLENIFMGAEDIRKQLPKETTLFEVINVDWKKLLELHRNQESIIESLANKELLTSLVKMNADLERIQKSLEMYLETKRQAFPRFFFISNDDLLEILGHAKDPPAIQPHFKKMFDNIHKLEMRSVGSEAVSQYEGLGMYSADGEYVKFTAPLKLDGPVENWLIDVESMMRMTLHKTLSATVQASKKSKRDRWLKDWPGQLLICSSLIKWTTECAKSLSEIERGEKDALRVYRKSHSSGLKRLSEMVLTPLSKVDRKKLMALVTIEVHSRDVIEKMIKTECANPAAFEWLSQLRFYWEQEEGEEECSIRQINTHFKYGYEYLGNSGRLVITPLTDRCYMTLTTALHLCRGGSPQGPAGTGKTETVKDLGKALGKFVIVQNCSDALDFVSLGRMFSGVAQTGAWGCFDEFNRIDIEVLSVVAQQISSILTAISRKLDSFMFEDKLIRLDRSCGIFITMNPGYAGRSELPDNLKALFRPVAMMVPDSALIAEIMLFAEGFANTKVFSKKVDTLYRLASQQLSKQDHYDFNLRSLTAALRNAGSKKRSNPNLSDDVVLYMAMQDNNMPKLTVNDIPLFTSILSDLFPSLEIVAIEIANLRSCIIQALTEKKLEICESTIVKVIQLHETKCMRHGVMLIGDSCSGKTTVWKILQATYGLLTKIQPELYQSVKTFVLNPKAVTVGELYGEYSASSGEWSDGIISSIMRNVCADEKPDQKWIVFDGPVDTLWIESMNTVLDDNKVLTLINGERIVLNENISLLFEIEDLSTASPATVSRAGMVYLDYKDLGYKPYFNTWLNLKSNPVISAIIREMSDKYIDIILTARSSYLIDVIEVPQLAAVKNFCKLCDICITQNSVDPTASEYARSIELWFVFAIIWSFGGPLNLDSRKQFDILLRSIDGRFPTKDTVFEYFVNDESKTWGLFEEKLSSSWKYSPNTPSYKIFVPSVDSIRNEFLIKTMIDNGVNVLVTGELGTGKTATITQMMENMLKSTNIITNLSAETTSYMLQAVIESHIEKRTKNIFVPLGGKKLVMLIDDYNMPSKDEYGAQSPLELLRLWMDQGFVYDRKKQFIKFIQDVSLICSMSTAGGRNKISSRMISRFGLVNFVFPSEASLTRILEGILDPKLQDFEEEVKNSKLSIIQTTIELFKMSSAMFLPTPTKSYYQFSLRDIIQTFHGVLRADYRYQDSKDGIMKIWAHEVFRVFSDRLLTEEDKTKFSVIFDTKLHANFNITTKQLLKDNESMFMELLVDSNSEQQMVYQEISSILEIKKSVEDRLAEILAETGKSTINIVFFKDALNHIAKISRIMTMANGHALLLGPGGSGRQSLAKLAAYLNKIVLFQIKPSKNYRHAEFREDVKSVYKIAGLDNQPIALLINEQDINNNVFLEDVSNLLATGEIPNLFNPDELNEVKLGLAQLADTEAKAVKLFVARARKNLHIVLCMSTTSDKFKKWIRMFPAIINCTCIDCFTDWPEDALDEVANRFLADIDVEDPMIISSLSKMCVQSHLSVKEESRKMLIEMRRKTFITPVNFLDLLRNFKQLSKTKKIEVNLASLKLKNGLQKLDDTRVSVEKISKELEVSKIQVSKFQKECDEYLVVIVQQKREADDQAKSVALRSEKLGVEEAEVRVVAEAAQADLDLAMPALNSATKALEAINKKDLNEIRSYAKPPALVEKVMEAIMVLKKSEPTWEEAKKQLGNQNFIKTLINFDKDNISDKILKKISQYCVDENFNPEVVGRVSGAAKSLCMWARAMETYGTIFRTVLPKKEKLKNAQDQLEKKQFTLRDSKEKLVEIQNKLQALKSQYEDKLELKEKLRKQSEDTEIKLKRAEQLVSGLSGEKIRWEESIRVYDASLKLILGDSLIASAFLSYAGPFDSAYRQNLLEVCWPKSMELLQIPFGSNASIESFLVKAIDIQNWNVQGLPADSFSKQNGTLVTQSSRWPLMIDPQSQANKWIKKLEGGRNLKVLDTRQSDCLKQIESAIQFGLPVLIQNLDEKIDPSFDSIISKSLTVKGSLVTIKIGDKEIEYNPNFKLYLTTKLPNPNYDPEIFSKTNVINFSVKEKGLEDQLLGIVVRKEKPDLEEQKSKLIVNVSNARIRILQLEDDILYLLSTASGSLLDDVKLVDALQSSKVTSEEVTKQLLISEETEKRIDIAREAYRSCAERSSILFFVLKDLAGIDSMYQFSLEFYTDLFESSIAASKKSEDINVRTETLNKYHTYSVYKNICRGLFEKHKLFFSLQIALKILESASKFNRIQFNFFLKSGGSIGTIESINPCKAWLPDGIWESTVELDKLAAFAGISNALEQNEKDWKNWYSTSEPESSPLPSEWETKLNAFEKMLVVKCLRSDRTLFSARLFVSSTLGAEYVDPPNLDIADVLKNSNPKTPLMFVLSSGVDPLATLQQLAITSKMENNFFYVALGQGQAPKATRLISEGMRLGNWVFLANCHLSLSWLSTLEKIIDSFSTESIHNDFRLWISSCPTPLFPISILQSSLKMTTEPPKGLKANMTRLITSVTEERFKRSTKPLVFQKLFFCLCFFHSLLLERKKFLTLGWNVVCDFNDSDFDVCENLIAVLLTEYKETPWDAMKYLIAEAHYGGRVTDDWDRRILRSYINHLFTNDAITQEDYPMSDSSVYVVPADMSLKKVKEYVSSLPLFDRPNAFGQHPNAEISSQMKETEGIIACLLMIQPQNVVSGTASKEVVVYGLSADILKNLPENIDFAQTFKVLQHDLFNPMNVVLLQEIQRYNELLNTMRSSMEELQRAINGFTLMTSITEEVFNALFEARVPAMWKKAYLSIKGLSAWIKDLTERVDYFQSWSKGQEPKVHWLAAFTFPTGFLTAVLQKTARKNNIAVDMLGWEFNVLTIDDESSIDGPPKDGVYVRGLFLEGAGWDSKNVCLKESNPMELSCSLPVIHMKPIEAKKKSMKGIYICPLYYYPIRAGIREKASFVIALELKSGAYESDFYIRRGTACLASL